MDNAAFKRIESKIMLYSNDNTVLYKKEKKRCLIYQTI